MANRLPSWALTPDTTSKGTGYGFDGDYSEVQPYTPGIDYIPTDQGVQEYVPKITDPYTPEVYTPNYPTQEDLDRKYTYSGLFDGEITQQQGRLEAALENAEQSVYDNIVDVSDDEWYMKGQLGKPSSQSIAAYEDRILSLAGASILNAKDIKSQAKKYSGPRTQWTPGAGNDEYQPNIVDAVTSSDILKEAPSYDGHPSAGVTYPQPSYVDPIQRIETTDPRIKDALAFEYFGSSEVFPTEDMGKWYDPGIPKGDIRAMMALEEGSEQPYPENINTTLSPSQLDAIQNPRLQAPSIFDDLLDSGGQFFEPPIPEQYAADRVIQDASSSLDPSVLKSLNNQAIGLITNPSGIAGYAAGLPQQVNKNPGGYVDSRDMQGYLEGEAFKESEYLSGLPTTGPAGATYGPQDISQGLITSQHPWAERRNSVNLPRERVPYGGERVQWNPGMASTERAQDERNSNVQMLKFLESRGLGSSQEAQDIRRTL